MTTIKNYYPENISPLTYFDNACAASSLKDALIDGSILTGIVDTCDKNGNLLLDLGGIRGIIPYDEFDFSPSGKQATSFARLVRVGKKTCFKVIGFEVDRNGERSAILSRREAQKECFENYVSSFKVGDTVSVCIIGTAPFGVFADVGCGMDALIPWNDLAVVRHSVENRPFNTGDAIYAVIGRIDEETRQIFLNTKALFGTWQENAADFNEGDTVTGIVSCKISGGWLVNLAPNLVGAIDEKKNADLSIGQRVSVYIKSKNPQNQKIKLCFIAALEENAFAPIDFAKYYVPLSTDFCNWDYLAPPDEDYSDREAS